MNNPDTIIWKKDGHNDIHYTRRNEEQGFDVPNRVELIGKDLATAIHLSLEQTPNTGTHDEDNDIDADVAAAIHLSLEKAPDTGTHNA